MFKKISALEMWKQIVFAIVIAFAVVSFWRGVWGLMDEYLFPEDYQLSLWVSILLGMLILLATGYVTEELL